LKTHAKKAYDDRGVSVGQDSQAQVGSLGFQGLEGEVESR
jgi:hypothetical protein